jgi:hypothetical protein
MVTAVVSVVFQHKSASNPHRGIEGQEVAVGRVIRSEELVVRRDESVRVASVNIDFQSQGLPASEGGVVLHGERLTEGVNDKYSTCISTGVSPRPASRSLGLYQLYQIVPLPGASRGQD